MAVNPYYDYMAVRETAMFFGRQEELNTLFIACTKRQSVSLVGTRLIGKSSILIHMQAQDLQKILGFDTELNHHIFVYIDMRDYLQHTLDDFFQELSGHIAARASKLVDLATSGRRGTERYTKILQDIHEAGYHVVLLMDVFDKVADERQFGPNFFSFLRSPQTKGWISYITASIKPLYQISPDEAASPFFNGFRTDIVGPLKADEVDLLISIPADKAGLPFSSTEVQWIREQAGRHPFFLQVTCHQLFEEKRRLKEGDKIDYQKVQRDIFAELAPKFESIWKELAEEQQREIKHEMHQTPNVKRKLGELSESALFRKHVSEKFQIEQQALTVKDVKDALDNRSDRAFLQTCRLATLHCLDARDDHRNVANNRGILVQEILKDALERMKPGGVHSDTAPEWRCYNILYYHYFRNVPNDPIAMRLSISRRQFYREQERAIQAMLDELLSMDAEALDG